MQKGAISGVSHLANRGLVYSKEGVHGQELEHFCFYRSWSRLDVGHATHLVNRELPFLINVLHNNTKAECISIVGKCGGSRKAVCACSKSPAS